MKRKTRKPTKPASLFKFLVDSGYLAPCSEIKALLGGGSWWILASKGRGMTLDRAREKCVEAGYLHCEGWNTSRPATSTINDLLDIIDREARGEKIYPNFWTPEEDSPYDPDERDYHTVPAIAGGSDAIPF